MRRGSSACASAGCSPPAWGSARGGGGWRVGWMLALGWGLAAVLGAIAGMMTAPSILIDPTFMQPVLLYAFAAAVLGGLESPAGAVVGGVGIGGVVNLPGAYVDWIGSVLRLPVALAVLLAVLLI